MSPSQVQILKNKAKLLQKAKKKAGKPILLKDAFALIARSSGFSSWGEFKKTLESNEALCPPGTSAHWKTWYASYEQARAHWQKQGGFLLPYQKHFFHCEIHYIESLGILKNDPDLEKVGANWVEPLDQEAWKRLLKKIKNRNLLRK